MTTVLIYTNKKRLIGVKPITDHENWGLLRITNENDLETAISAIKKSFALMRSAINDNINTSWYAITPREKMTLAKTNKVDDFDENEEQIVSHIILL